MFFRPFSLAMSSTLTWIPDPHKYFGTFLKAQPMLHGKGHAGRETETKWEIAIDER
jgi:hypothetical protein